MPNLADGQAGPSGQGSILPGPAGISLAAVQALIEEKASAASVSPAAGSDDWLKAWGSNVDALIRATTITRSLTEAATGLSVIWPDGTAGVYVGTESTGTGGAVDSYTITYVGATTKTVTQPTMTRNAAGSVVVRPDLTVT